MVYSYSQGIMNSQSSGIQSECYYHGYVEGHLNSLAILSTCSGLRGILHFGNVSYGIEPLDSTVEFQHVLYQLGDENSELGILTKNSRSMEKYAVGYNIFISEKSETPVPDLLPLYLEMYIVVDKALYDYLGSDSVTITNKVIEMINIVNSMFAQLNVMIVLSSLELWSDTNKISTDGEADELLYKFLEWKQSHLSLKPHDVAFLFIYRDYPDYVAATFPEKMCFIPYSAGIALYPKGMTLETFAVIVTQMLGLSLGIAYDDPVKCQCSEAICIMNLEAMQSGGVKTFSSCSLSDFQRFISKVGVGCLQNKPQMQRGQRCGNGIREGNEFCDCGTIQQCGIYNCCDHETCQMKISSQCLGGPCCHFCLFSGANVVCRAKKDPECDVEEYCTGVSPRCPGDVYIRNGHLCKSNKHMCYNGFCIDLDSRCEQNFGKGSRNAPFLCYKEIHSQIDRFGNCGSRDGIMTYCGWRNSMCGRLVCTFPTRKPYIRTNATAIYVRVKNYTCITADFNRYGDFVSADTFRIPDGSECDTERICINYSCVEIGDLKSSAESCKGRCSGHGLCNSQGTCYCQRGYRPPYCQGVPFFRSALWDINRYLIGASEKADANWLLSFYIGLSILIIVTLVVIAWNRLKTMFTKEEESLSTEN
ncbi:disintegrin and metalloproteinase domain-containing protein 32-like [Fukomys damarensis]|uniref:disintegrin and metalloproteinase domain-containing protein 32-like n=1 Tax=Fukomys damarensis TaxID=885580 RepID=UPI00053FF058|nr:disintegrin and metalloproteinase domain-containing protein 32-like [Fukomys damarensis]